MPLEVMWVAELSLDFWASVISDYHGVVSNDELSAYCGR